MLKPVEIREGSGDKEKWARLLPHDGFKLDFFIEFNHPAADGTMQNATVDFAQVSYVHDVARGIGLDGRIGRKFLHPGPGFGGSCFPKDTLALAYTAREVGAPQTIVEQVIEDLLQ